MLPTDNSGYAQANGTASNTVTVTSPPSNAAPTIALTGDNTANEGQTKTYSFSVSTDSGATSPYSVVSQSCGANGTPSNPVFNSATGAGSFDCTFPDGPASSTVSVQIADSGSANSNSNTPSIVVTIANVPPTIALTGASSVDEGSLYTLGLGAITDPGQDTVTAYSVDWGDGTIENFTGVPSGNKTHTYADGPNNYTITVALTDEDGTFANAGSKAVTVDNVAPTISSLVAGAAAACGGSNTLAINFSDPAGTNDTYTAVVDWGDGNSDTYSNVSSGFPASHAYALAGQYTASVTVSDEDGGTSASASATLTLNFTIVGGGILQPINPGPPLSLFKYKSTIPVKIKVQDCDGSFPGTLAPTIKVTWVSGTTPPGTDEAIYSTSAADTGTTMRFTDMPDYQYIYNLATKSLSDATAKYHITITIPLTGQTVQADFGLKP